MFKNPDKSPKIQILTFPHVNRNSIRSGLPWSGPLIDLVSTEVSEGVDSPSLLPHLAPAWRRGSACWGPPAPPPRRRSRCRSASEPGLRRRAPLTERLQFQRESQILFPRKAKLAQTNM